MKRPRQHQTGDLAENIVAGAFLSEGWIVNPCTSDYGYDFLVHRLDGSGGQPIFALLQVKGRATSIKIDSEKRFSFSVSTDHLALWNRTPIPVYLCIVEVTSSRLFVVDTKEVVAFLRKSNIKSLSEAKSRSFHISTASVFSSDRADEIFKDVDDYWKRIREIWRIAVVAESAGPALYISWLGGVIALENAIGFQISLEELMGKRDANALLGLAGLKTVKMPRDEWY